MKLDNSHSSLWEIGAWSSGLFRYLLNTSSMFSVVPNIWERLALCALELWISAGQELQKPWDSGKQELPLKVLLVYVVFRIIFADKCQIISPRKRCRYLDWEVGDMNIKTERFLRNNSVINCEVVNMDLIRPAHP